MRFDPRSRFVGAGGQLHEAEQPGTCVRARIADTVKKLAESEIAGNASRLWGRPAMCRQDCDSIH